MSMLPQEQFVQFVHEQFVHELIRYDLPTRYTVNLKSRWKGCGAEGDGGFAVDHQL